MNQIHIPDPLPAPIFLVFIACAIVSMGVLCFSSGLMAAIYLLQYIEHRTHQNAAPEPTEVHESNTIDAYSYKVGLDVSDLPHAQPINPYASPRS